MPISWPSSVTSAPCSIALRSPPQRQRRQWQADRLPRQPDQSAQRSRGQHAGRALQLDAAQVDERRNRLSQAERRYVDVSKNPQIGEQATALLEKLYRQQRRFNDLAALLEKRRATAAPSAQYGILLDLGELYRETNKYQLALNSITAALAINAHDDAPYALQARIFEAQRMWQRAVEAYGRRLSARAQSGDRAARSLVAAADLCERKLNQASEALRALHRGPDAGVWRAYEPSGSQGSKPDAQLIADRDAAWSGAERLLRVTKRCAISARWMRCTSTA